MTAFLQIDFVCPTCGTEGYGMWRPQGAHYPHWELIAMSDDFGRKAGGVVTPEPSVVCKGCDAVLSD